MPDYQPLLDHGTNGANFDLSTQDIVERLKAWDGEYGIEIGDVKHDALTVVFDRLPDDVRPLADEIYDFCPDVVDQHYGCVVEMMDLAEETGEEVPENIRELTEGVDLEAEDYGVELLKRDLERTKTCGLWWD